VQPGTRCVAPESVSWIRALDRIDRSPTRDKRCSLTTVPPIRHCRSHPSFGSTSQGSMWLRLQPVSRARRHDPSFATGSPLRLSPTPPRLARSTTWHKGAKLRSPKATRARLRVTALQTPLPRCISAFALLLSLDLVWAIPGA
jgi:hypothetical protein